MDFFNSFFQNVKDKLTNPFFGTLGFVLIIHHWEFWYTLFNFNSKTSLHLKIETLKVIGSKEFHWRNIIQDLGWTILIVIIGYAIIVATRSLSLFIDFRVMPHITKEVISDKVVSRSEYEDVSSDRDYYAGRYEEEKKYTRELSKNHHQQSEELLEKNLLIRENNDLITNLNNTINALNNAISTKDNDSKTLLDETLLNKKLISKKEEEIENLKEFNELLEAKVGDYNNLFYNRDNTIYWLSVDRFPPSIENIVENIKSDGQWSNFLSVANYEKNGGSISVATIDKLKKYGIVSSDISSQLNVVGKLIAFYINKFK